MLIVNALGLPTADIAILFSVEWFLDRCRSFGNVLSDCVGALIVAGEANEHLDEAVGGKLLEHT